MARANRLSSVTFQELYPKRTDGLCRCGCEAPAKRSWHARHCEAEAVAHYRLKKGYSKAIREAVFARDKGICADCKLDTEAERMRMLTGDNWRIHSAKERRELCRPWIEKGFPWPGKTWWQADHDQELADGGQHDLDNLVTRCVACHKAKTAASARARAQRRSGR